MSKQGYGFEKRIGATNYKVGVYFSQTGRTFEEKVLRLVKNDLTLGTERGIMKTPRTVGLPGRGSL